MPDFDPCGMVVDLVRSCYRTKMRFFQNNLTEETDVQWYFTQPDAAPLANGTRFGSGNWASERWDWPGVGEVLGAPRPWSSGARDPAYQGLTPCGTDEQFAEGTFYPPAPFPRSSNNVPVCCNAMRLGVGIDGLVSEPVQCSPFFPIFHLYPPSLNITMSGWSMYAGCVDATPLNGTHALISGLGLDDCDFYVQTAPGVEVVCYLRFGTDGTIFMLVYNRVTPGGAAYEGTVTAPGYPFTVTLPAFGSPTPGCLLMPSSVTITVDRP